MRCPNCGTEIGDESIFCLNCGTKLQFSTNDTQKVSESVVPPVQQPTYIQPEQEPHAQGGIGSEPVGMSEEAANQPGEPAPQPQQNFRDPYGTPGGFAASGYDAPPQKNPYVTPGTPNGPESRPVQMGAPDDLAPIVKMGSWFGTLILWFLIPVAISVIAAGVSAVLPHHGIGGILATILWIVAALSSLIFVLIMAFNKRVNPSKRNFFKAYLLLFLILLVVLIVLFIILALTSASLLGNLPALSYYYYYNF